MDRQRCELTSTAKTSRRGDATSSAVGVGTRHITPVGQATQRLGSEIAGLRQAEEGRVSPTADGQRRESSPTASCYNLKNTRTRACRRVTAVGPGVRLATSPARATASKTGNGRDTPRGDKNREARKRNDGAPTTRRRSTHTTHTHHTHTQHTPHTHTNTQHTHAHTHTHTHTHTPHTHTPHTHIHSSQGMHTNTLLYL